jgi:choline dehydrogenase
VHPEAVEYVVVGGGSAGCVAAGVLSEDPATRVLLLECGPAGEDNPETLVAAGYKQAFINDDIIWDRFSERQARCGGQHLFMGSGTGMGGSGAVNAMVYTRGSRLDYDEWPTGWRWDDCLPHFEAVEAKLRPRRRPPTTFSEVCIAAAVEAGFRRAEDLNDGDLSSVLGYEWMNYEGEQRRSSYVAFIKEQPRANLMVQTRARVLRVELDASKRVRAVIYRDKEGQGHRVTVTREVLMCAGALETPKLLMLSGIGPGAALRAAGVGVGHELAGVGRDLHDHPNVTLFFRGNNYVDFYHPQLYGFTRANPSSDLPAGQSDTCVVFYSGNSSLYEASKRMIPYKLFGGPRYGPRKRDLTRGAVEFAFRRGVIKRLVAELYGVVVILGKPKSRGRLTLRSRRAEDAAVLDPGYFSDPEDLQTMVAGVRKAREITASRALASWGNRELLPGPGKRSDRALAKWIEHNAMTTFHYAGTCRMGEDAAAVVDTRGRVRGVAGLRIADASVTPWTPVSAMNAPSMMVGHRMASFALEEARGGSS